MARNSLNNKGMTLIEMVVCFALLGILMVVAAQIIHSCTEAYYNTKTTGNGSQAAQMIATELRGELEDALPLFIKNNDYYVKIGSQQNSIEFIDEKGNDVKYRLVPTGDGYMLQKETVAVYDTQRLSLLNSAESPIILNYDSNYIGMGYTVKDIEFSIYKNSTFNVPAASNSLPISDCPVLEIKITVGNKKYDDFETREYVALYNFSGLDDVNTKIYIGV